MKADHRKELQTNVLADYLGNALQHAKERPSQKVLLYGGLILLAVVLVVVFIWFSAHSKDNDALRWAKLYELSRESQTDDNSDELKKLQADYSVRTMNGPVKSDEWIKQMYEAKKFEAENSGTSQAREFRFKRARLLMQNPEGLNSNNPRERDITRKCITEGRDLYQTLIGESGDDPQLAAEALLNAGKGNEDLVDFEQAKKYYERVNKEYPKSEQAAEAEKGLMRLNDNNYRDFMKKLAENKAD